MKKISLTFKKPQISINGEIFDVSRSDAAIIRDLLELDRRFEGADMNDPGSVLEKNEAMLAYIDRLLGPGAVERILAGVKGMEGFDLGLAGIGELTAQIARLAGAAYAESIRAKYDD